MKRHLRAIAWSVNNANARRTALWVALVIGAILIAINQGIPLLVGEPMTLGRWISTLVTPIVPFFVSCHGQGLNHS
jgi:hypothetical protein